MAKIQTSTSWTAKCKEPCGKVHAPYDNMGRRIVVVTCKCGEMHILHKIDGKRERTIEGVSYDKFREDLAQQAKKLREKEKVTNLV